ncbi:hypothetical protein EDC04DRAFT_2782946 [Pisolithus marmoratus]|nr:hypothetical protein EDC04DRAFT_2782946 [Pisolithus marmoratus]
MHWNYPALDILIALITPFCLSDRYVNQGVVANLEEAVLLGCTATVELRPSGPPNFTNLLVPSRQVPEACSDAWPDVELDKPHCAAILELGAFFTFSSIFVIRGTFCVSDSFSEAGDGGQLGIKPEGSENLRLTWLTALTRHTPYFMTYDNSSSVARVPGLGRWKL